jgi:peptide/nickel transport system permease protein
MLALAIVSVLKPSTTNAMLAIAVVIIPGNSRIVRRAVLSAKQNRYVEAAQALGCRHSPGTKSVSASSGGRPRRGRTRDTG